MGGGHQQRAVLEHDAPHQDPLGRPVNAPSQPKAVSHITRNWCRTSPEPASRIKRNRSGADQPEQHKLLAQLASHNANNPLTIEGPVLSLAPRHAKVRRDGYRR